MRLTRWVSAIPAPVKLLVAPPLMGVPFLLVNANGSVPAIARVIALFVTSEMLWAPTSQAVVADLAPADIRERGPPSSASMGHPVATSAWWGPR